MDGGAVAQDGHTVADGAQFFEAMGDIDHADAACAQGADDAEDFFGLRA